MTALEYFKKNKHNYEFESTDNGEFVEVDEYEIIRMFEDYERLVKNLNLYDVINLYCDCCDTKLEVNFISVGAYCNKCKLPKPIGI